MGIKEGPLKKVPGGEEPDYRFGLQKLALDGQLALSMAPA